MGHESGRGLAGSCASHSGSLVKLSRCLPWLGAHPKVWLGRACFRAYSQDLDAGRIQFPAGWAGILSSLLCGHLHHRIYFIKPVRESVSKIEVSVSSTEGLSRKWHHLCYILLIKSKSQVLPTCRITQGSGCQEIGIAGWERILETACYRIELHGTSLNLDTFATYLQANWGSW